MAIAANDPQIGLNGQNKLNVIGGPELTASGLGAAGALTPNAPVTDLALTGGMETVKATFDKLIRWRNRWEPMYQNFANVRAVRDAAFPGSKVTLYRTGAAGLPLAVSPLSEYADPDAVALPGLEDKMDVTVDEYGTATVVTQRLQRFSWTQINPMQVEYIARNMRDSVDAVYMNAIYSNAGGFLGGGFRQAEALAAGVIKTTGDGTMAEDKMFKGSVVIGGGGRGGAASAGTGLADLSASHIRRIVAHFRNLGVAPMADGLYLGLITPDASVALRETTDLAGWRYPHLEENANDNIWRGTVGIFEGVRFIEGPQFKGLDKGATVAANTGNIVNVAPTKGSANILFLGAEGIADVIVEQPHTVITPQSDKFGRLFGLGWIGCFGAQVYDNNAGLLVAVK